MKKLLSISFVFAALSSGVFSQNVGIGTSTPDYKLEVIGPIHSTNAYFDGSVSIGTTSPVNKLQVNNG